MIERRLFGARRLRVLVFAVLASASCGQDTTSAPPPDAAPDAPDAPPPPTACDIHCEACAPGSSTCVAECGNITVDCDEGGLQAIATCHADDNQACGVLLTACLDQVGCWVANLTCGNSTCDPGDDVNCPADCNDPTCDHSECEAGTPLNASCTTCTATVCANDPYCCESDWDLNCVEAAIFSCDICL